ncbi:MAG: helix-turn-helix domain-containing protein [Thermomicrobium sp.]|nr:helix-turn-helix domain-containing protein [Thermomicrobium sp.]
MTIRELAERSGVPPRRIRYYVARGLLPPPIGRGPTARYDTTHLQRLRLIGELRERRLGLDEIRSELTRTDERSEATLWKQWEIRPGVLLCARADLPVHECERVFALVAVARRLLGGSDVTAHDERT